MNKRVIRLYTGADGKSHFEDIELRLELKFSIGGETVSIAVDGMNIRENDGKQDVDWHNSPYRHLLMPVEGECEMEVDDGSRRIIGPGDILLAEDTTGQGHVTRAVRHQTRKAIVMPY